MTTIVQRPLIDIAVEASGVSGSSEDFALVAVDPVGMGAVGLAETVREAVKAGQLYRSAAEIARDGFGLRLLALVHLVARVEVKAVWVVDGWSLIKLQGRGADLRGANLRGADLRGAQLAGADISGADLSGADLEKADLTSARLVGADLSGCNLFSANLRRVDLTEADVRRADMRYADMREATCSRTAFRGADFWQAYLWNVDMSEAFTTGADYERSDHLNEKVIRGA